MDNVLGTQGVPLTVFGGAVPELAPEDLPEGASPFNQDVDFNPGSVFTRAGRVNQIVYGSLNQGNLPGLAQSVLPGAAAWSNPNNIKLNTPGTYATMQLLIGGGGSTPALDQPVTASNTTGVSGTLAYGPFTPITSNEYVFSVVDSNSPTGILPNSAFIGAPAYFMTTALGSLNPATLTAQYSAGATGCCVSSFSAITVGGAAPIYPQKASAVYAGLGGSLSLGGPVASGNSVIIGVASNFITSATGISGTDNKGNTYSVPAFLMGPGGNTPFFTAWLLLQNITNGPSNFSFTITGSGGTGGTFIVAEVSNLLSGPPAVSGQILRAQQFGFLLGTNLAITGMQIRLSGHQSSTDPSATLTVALTAQPGTPTFTVQLPAVDGVINVGTPTTPWGVALTPSFFNNPLFGVDITPASAVPVTFSLYAVQVIVFLSPSPPANINWLHTYQQTDAEIDTMVLDANGVLWDEDVDTNAGVLNSIFATILANTYAKGVTFADIEYIAFSNLLNGTDVPRQWNGTNLDRISMVGPGEAPQASSAGTGTGGSGSIAIQTITQQPKVQIRRIAFGTAASPNDSTPGNLLVIYGEGRTPANPYQTLPPYTPTFGSGTTVVLSSVTNPFPLKGGGTLPYNLNGTYTVGPVSQQIVGGSEQCPTFTLPSPTTTWAYSADYGSGGTPTSGWFYQSCIATVTMQNPLPNVGVGSSITISGTGGGPPGGYDGTWTVLQAPNTSQMTINSAQASGNTLIYSYTLLPGSTAPTVGQTVTITNCLNGSGLGDINVFNRTAAISAVGGGTFSISFNTVDIPLQTQNATPQATAIVAGTVFTFDAGQIVSGYSGSGGLVVQQGLVAVGQRKVCYSFLTRSGYITQPSPISTFNITGSSGAITVTGLSIGPPNVVARIVFFTGAGGGNFFYIPQEVDVTVGGVTQKSLSTIVNDNSSTTAQFSFSDTVLLSATAIDIPGNNLFNTIELGSSRGLVNYSSRLFVWGEQAKVTNFRNLSFDGGYKGSVIQGANITVPLGWTLDPTNGSGGSLLLSSPVFGWSYQISNTSGSSQAKYGMLTQNAWQDEFGVPIIQANTLYSVRIAVAAPTPIASGNLIVDLFSPTVGVASGTFSLPLTSLTSSMQIFTGTLLTIPLTTSTLNNKDLQLRIWAQNIPNNSSIVIDRVEPFPTLTPANTVALKGSYVNNQEAYDLVTGVCGPAQNMQPINGAAELFDLLYALKEKSWYSTFDNGVTEPNKWNWKEVSNKVGSIGQNAYDYGEGWMLTADREGVHFFEGGEPIKISQEIQPVWDLINWQYGYTIWLRNDPEQRRLTVGIPIPTPNQFMPEFPVNANPTTPNVILMCNYRELNTGGALAQTGPIRSTYTGRLMSPEPARKWSFWNIACPYSDFISRNNSQWPQWFGTGYQDSKIFALQASALADDGLAINSFWISYGFTKPEMADAKGLGLFRMEFPYLTVLAIGNGILNPYVYPESPFNSPYVLDILPLPAISQGDLELGVNAKGNRFFIRVGTNAVGASFRCSKLVVPLVPDPWSPIRGWNAVIA